MEEWTTIDNALLAAALGATWADIQTTKAALQREGRETNPLLGENPSKSKLNNIGLATALLGAGGVLDLPKEARRPILAGWAGMRASLAYQNKRDKNFGGSFTKAMKRPLAIGLTAALLAHTLLNDSTNIDVDVKDGLAIRYTKRF